jgi:hypothetical protein
VGRRGTGELMSSDVSADSVLFSDIVMGMKSD